MSAFCIEKKISYKMSFLICFFPEKQKKVRIKETTTTKHVQKPLHTHRPYLDKFDKIYILKFHSR